MEGKWYDLQLASTEPIPRWRILTLTKQASKLLTGSMLSKEGELPPNKLYLRLGPKRQNSAVNHEDSLCFCVIKKQFTTKQIRELKTHHNLQGQQLVWLKHDQKWCGRAATRGRLWCFDLTCQDLSGQPSLLRAQPMLATNHPNACMSSFRWHLLICSAKRTTVIYCTSNTTFTQQKPWKLKHSLSKLLDSFVSQSITGQKGGFWWKGVH